MGSRPREETIAIRRQLEQSIVASANVPETLLFGGGGTSFREAYRYFVSTSIVPLAGVLEDELRAKVDSGISVSTANVNAADEVSKSRAVASRANAYKNLVAAGMGADEAKVAAGLA